MEELIGQRVIFVTSATYKWRARVVALMGPFAKVEDVRQVIGHTATEISEEIVWGTTWVHLEKCDTFSLEEGTAWIPQASTKKKARA